MSVARADVLHRALSLVERLFDALTDPARRTRTLIAVLSGYAVIWTLYGIVSKSSQDMHFDMGEMVAWSRDVGLSAPNHPPLGPWLVGAWFAVFPLADWAYYLFAILMPTLAMGVAWQLAGRTLDAERRVIAVALLTFIPFFNFLGLKFGATTVLMPFWAAATLWLILSFETRHLGYAALAGVAAAAGMLGKYWTIVLLAGLALAAISDPRRGRYFRSAAPWVTAGVGLLALLPHLIGMLGSDRGPLGFALNKYPAEDLWSAFVSGVGYILGIAGYVAAPVLIAFAALRPKPGDIAEMAWPHDPDRRFLAVTFFAALIVPLAVVLAFKVRVVSVWGMAGLVPLPILILSSPRVVLTRIMAVRILAIALAFPLVMLVLSPVIASVIHQSGLPHHRDNYRQIAGAVDKAWRDSTGRPLRLFASQLNVLYGAIFYLPGRPSAFLFGDPAQTPWVDDARIARDGLAMVCPVDDADCLGPMQRWSERLGATRRTEVELSRTHFGINGKASRYVIVVAPPL